MFEQVKIKELISRNKLLIIIHLILCYELSYNLCHRYYNTQYNKQNRKYILITRKKKFLYYIYPTHFYLFFATISLDPRFAEYHLNFTNHVTNKDLEQIAELDESGLVKTV